RKQSLKRVKIEPEDLICLIDDEKGPMVKGTRNGRMQGKSAAVQGMNASVQGKSAAVQGSGNSCCEWVAPVTRAIQNLKNKQTLHLPARVVEVCLQAKSEIKLRSRQTNRIYKCAILNPGRGKHERYIATGWYDYLNDHKPKVGDLLIFAVENPPNVMDVNLIRKDRTR
ncbi:hypothetical protein L195_g046676, partial [Trifolium pratense]